jgi:hypothetical protein
VENLALPKVSRDSTRGNTEGTDLPAPVLSHVESLGGAEREGAGIPNGPWDLRPAFSLRQNLTQRHSERRLGTVRRLSRVVDPPLGIRYET